MKKQYKKPSMKVYEMKVQSRLLQYSGDFNYVPTIPGQQDDMNKLA